MTVEALPPPPAEAAPISVIDVAPLECESTTSTEQLAPAAPDPYAGLQSMDEWHEFVRSVFNDASNVLSPPLRTLQAAAGGCRPFSDALYRVFARMEFMRWILQEGGNVQFAKDMIVILGFSYGLVQAVRAEIAERVAQEQAQQRQTVEGQAA